MDSLVLQPQTHMLMFRNFMDIETFAAKIAQSAFVPPAFRGKEGDIVAAVLYGLERGLSPMASLQNIAVINGKPSIYGDMLKALCLTDPSTEYIDESEPEEIKKTQRAWCEAKRKDKRLVRRTFSLEDAQKAGLLTKEGPWRQYPERMLLMRARSWCLRDAFPDRLMGLQASEESGDLIDVTPSPVPVAPEAPSPDAERLPDAVVVQQAMQRFHQRDAEVQAEASQEPSQEPSPPPYPAVYDTMTTKQLRQAIKGQFTRLADTFHESFLLRQAFGVETIEAYAKLPADALKRGLAILEPMRLPEPPVSDVPDYRASPGTPEAFDAESDGNPAERGHDPTKGIQGEAIGDPDASQEVEEGVSGPFADGVTAVPEVSAAEVFDDTLTPPDLEVRGGFLSFASHAVLEGWCAMHGHPEVWEEVYHDKALTALQGQQVINQVQVRLAQARAR